MTDHHDIAGATAGPWRFVPSHVAEGPSEVRSPEGWLICTTSSDVDAALIVRAVNEHESLKTHLAEVEGKRQELAIRLGHLVNSLKQAEARALAAEARFAVLEKALERVRDLSAPGQMIGISQAVDILCDIWNAARTALAAEQKEAGK